MAARLEDSDAGVRRAVVEVLGRMLVEVQSADMGSVSSMLRDHRVTISTADAELVIAQLRSSRWHRTGGGSSDGGKTLSIDHDLAWGDDGVEKQHSISHTANFITTNGWWVAYVTFKAERLASIEWRGGSNFMTWARREMEEVARSVV